MRTIKILALTVALAAVPTLEAQQAVAPRFTEQPLPRLSESTQPSNGTVPSRIAPIPADRDAKASAAAARELTAMNVLTIIGAIVVVVAVVGLVF